MPFLYLFPTFLCLFFTFLFHLVPGLFHFLYMFNLFFNLQLHLYCTCYLPLCYRLFNLTSAFVSMDRTFFAPHAKTWCQKSRVHIALLGNGWGINSHLTSPCMALQRLSTRLSSDGGQAVSRIHPASPRRSPGAHSTWRRRAGSDFHHVPGGSYENEPLQDQNEPGRETQKGDF